MLFVSASVSLSNHLVRFKEIGMLDRYCHRFFDQVGHETMYASSRNKHFSTIINVPVRPIKIMNRANQN